MVRQAFYGLANYNANPTSFNARVKINTPITSDRYGNIFFGFEVTSPGTTNPSLQSGIARITEDGSGSWISAVAATPSYPSDPYPNDLDISKVVHNCAPALSNDQKTLYFAVNTSDFGPGYLVSVDSRTLAPIAKAR